MVVSLAIAVLADGVAGLAGGLLPERVLHEYARVLVGFAAGAILAAFFFDLWPEAHRALGDTCAAWTLGGFIVMALGQRLLEPHAQGHAHGPDHRPVDPRLLLTADALHNLGDGVALAAAFVASSKAGWAMTAAVLFHELPHEIGDYALLRAGGWSKGKALLALVVIQLCSGLGAGGLLALQLAGPNLAPIVLALAAGSFLHIGATNLLPHLAQGTRREKLHGGAGFTAGAILVVGLSYL
jgi:zinc and cadmium transporter